MSSIVGLKGQKITSAGADESLIALCREILAEAERGDIIGLATVTVRRNHMIGTRVRNTGGVRHLMLAGTVYLQHDIAKEREHDSRRKRTPGGALSAAPLGLVREGRIYTGQNDRTLDVWTIRNIYP
jgi:hypothetical protein